MAEPGHWDGTGTAQRLEPIGESGIRPSVPVKSAFFVWGRTTPGGCFFYARARAAHWDVLGRGTSYDWDACYKGGLIPAQNRRVMRRKTGTRP